MYNSKRWRCCSGRCLWEFYTQFPPKVWNNLTRMNFVFFPATSDYSFSYIKCTFYFVQRETIGQVWDISLVSSEFIDCRQDVGSLPFPQILRAGLLWKSSQMCARGWIVFLQEWEQCLQNLSALFLPLSLPLAARLEMKKNPSEMMKQWEPNVLPSVFCSATWNNTCLLWEQLREAAADLYSQTGVFLWK